MSRLLISLGLFLLTIIFIIIAVVIGKAGITSDNNEADCEARNKHTIKPGGVCYMWANSKVCLKGKIKQGKCVHPAEPVVL